jgi:hypothetical protein
LSTLQAGLPAAGVRQEEGGGMSLFSPSPESDARYWAGRASEELRKNIQLESEKTRVYLERNQLVALLARLYPSGLARTAIEGWSPDWHGCVYIDLPTGQASWHFHDSQAYLFAGLPLYTKPWDGHSTEEKYRRVAALGVSA